MAKRNTKKPTDPNDLEIYPTVTGYEVVLRKAERLEGRQYFQVVVRSLDGVSSFQLLLTDKKALATRQLMAFHAGACAMQHLVAHA